MNKSLLILTALAAVAVHPGFAQKSPPAEATATVGGKTITIKYSAPSVRGRKIFGDGGQLSHDGTYPVWRAGANSATSFHTDANLDIKGLQVPAGDYTLYVDVANPDQWELIINKQTGQWGTVYKKEMDLGRVKMDMSKPAALVETYKVTLSSTGGSAGTLRLEWENHSASVPFTVK